MCTRLYYFIAPVPGSQLPKFRLVPNGFSSVYVLLKQGCLFENGKVTLKFITFTGGWGTSVTTIPQYSQYPTILYYVHISMYPYNCPLLSQIGENIDKLGVNANCKLGQQLTS